jgi:heterodisulfide reductase subunit C
METPKSADDVFVQAGVQNCYQCGKCTAGCPMAEEMDLMPNQIVRLVQRGLIDRAMQCLGIWYCVSCQTCSARCPQSVDCAGVMDGVRQQAVENGIIPQAPRRIYLFQKAFLDNVRRNGRVNEVELIAQFKTIAFMKDRSLALLLKDAFLAPKLMQRGKFHVWGEKVRDRAVVRRIFDRCMKREDGQAEATTQGSRR